MRRSLGLDDPVPIQFARYLVRAAQGDFGVSYQLRQPVSTLLAERMPATLELAICATLFAVGFGILMGVYSALRREVSRQLLQTVSLIGISLPTFLIGILLIYLFAVILGWLPSFGRGDTVQLGWWSTGLPHPLRPQGAHPAVGDARPLPDDADHAARPRRDAGGPAHRLHPVRARAASRTRAIHFGHALKNTLVPVITIVGLQFGSVIAFAIITETVFQWPGMGLLFVQAVQNVDIPIMAAYLMLVALIFVTINLAVDILYIRSIRACARPSGSRPEPMTEGLEAAPVFAPQPPPPRSCALMGRFLDSDIWVSFRRSKLTMAAALHPAVLHHGSGGRPRGRRRIRSIRRSSSS